MKRPIKFTICGFGHIGKRHSHMITQNSSAELYAIIDSDSNKIEEAKKLYPEIMYFNSIEEYIQNESADVGIVASPNYLHTYHAQLFLSKNHHTVIEKPMGLSYNECLKIAEFNPELHKFCVMQNRYSPPAKLLKEIINNNQLGTIYMIQVNCFWNRDERYYMPKTWRGSKEKDGGTLFTQFSHFIDILYWLFGDFNNIQTKLYNFGNKHYTEIEDSGTVTFEFKNGAHACLQFSTAIYDINFESSITIIGENGTIKVGGQYMDQIVYCHIKDYTLPVIEKTSAPNDYGSYKGSANNHDQVIQNVIDTLNGKSTPHTTVKEGAEVVRIIENIYQANR